VHASQLDLPTVKDHLPDGCSALELGCGSGYSTVYLRETLLAHWDSVQGVDIETLAIDRCKHLHPQYRDSFICADLFQFLNTRHQQYNLVFDCQCFHAVALGDDKELQYSDLVAQALRPDGLLIMLCGNDKEPQRQPGPAVVSQELLRRTFSRANGWNIEVLQETRFDATSAYGEEGPLAWLAIIRRI
jgi:SAM-dependent methyltransferase